MSSEATRTIGARAEGRVALFLEQQGYFIRERNWSCRGGEIDLVAERDGVLVFVEVRSRRNVRYGSPLETVRDRKRQRIIHAARTYLTLHGLWSRVCRFDVVGVVDRHIEHVEDAFSTGE